MSSARSFLQLSERCASEGSMSPDYFVTDVPDRSGYQRVETVSPIKIQLGLSSADQANIS